MRVWLGDYVHLLLFLYSRLLNSIFLSYRIGSAPVRIFPAIGKIFQTQLISAVLTVNYVVFNMVFWHSHSPVIFIRKHLCCNARKLIGSRWNKNNTDIILPSTCEKLLACHRNVTVESATRIKIIFIESTFPLWEFFAIVKIYNYNVANYTINNAEQHCLQYPRLEFITLGIYENEFDEAWKLRNLNWKNFKLTKLGYEEGLKQFPFI